MASGNTWKTRCPKGLWGGSKVVQGMKVVCTYVHIYTNILYSHLVHDIFTNNYPHSFLHICKAYVSIINYTYPNYAEIFISKDTSAWIFARILLNHLSLTTSSYDSTRPHFQVAVDVVRSATKSNVTCRASSDSLGKWTPRSVSKCGLNGTSPSLGANDD